ncbi:MAG TPA: competence/damage-inducible protein A [Sediminibacterium sp.]|uniref:competence/damage-inducible protein A n=1 Tax=Sediminibacterium sp. TaxID=1917865 RepID=UPI0008D7F1A0|nr:competence/damage-inducible protein A [Sediminibacterium sp.]OHC84291.1 MAG: damage-inducible protein CinA [Sphingobacteriia bacterium RIFOXYC2_FULL_35_18]OHC88759.1 MAG: damage-inducible protein CinA [Sphingobacteriia bacterium RIFOXYD2_FULL_35_12]HLD53902.1 competence/damage-inducible protein A [Sediminibacterium sp.]
MNKIYASIITIGDELLIGQVIDTNSSWIAQELNKAGILVKNRVAVGDNREDIWQAIDDAISKSTLVLITGGLGPTADDITKPLLCDYFGGKMVMDQATLDHVTYIFKEILRRPMIERNTLQAQVPDVCTVLKNEKGTAPGMLFTKNEVKVIAMPGVPHEMKWIMHNHVMPLAAQWFNSGYIEHRTLLTAGIGESFLAEQISSFETALPSHIKLAYLPNYGMVRLRLSAWGNNQTDLNKELDNQFNQLKNNVLEYLVTDKDEPMEMVIGHLLKQKNQTVSTAESCTGGYIAHLLSKHAGSSTFYTGSIISYANIIKEQLLDVPHETLMTVGAVSKEAVKQMAVAVREKMNTDYAIAVSGIMGPGGATEEKAVGLVWIAVASKNNVVTKHFQFRFDRERNISLTAINALNMLRAMIVDNS